MRLTIVRQANEAVEGTEAWAREPLRVPRGTACGAEIIYAYARARAADGSGAARTGCHRPGRLGRLNPPDRPARRRNASGRAGHLLELRRRDLEHPLRRRVRRQLPVLRTRRHAPGVGPPRVLRGASGRADAERRGRRRRCADARPPRLLCHSQNRFDAQHPHLGRWSAERGSLPRARRNQKALEPRGRGVRNRRRAGRRVVTCRARPDARRERRPPGCVPRHRLPPHPSLPRQARKSRAASSASWFPGSRTSRSCGP